MIVLNELDKEGYIRSKNLTELKKNTFLLEGDIVKIPSDLNYFVITSEETDLRLENGLYAKKIYLEDQELKTNDKTLIGAINELKEYNSVRVAERLSTPRLIHGVEFDGTKDIELEVADKEHSHNVRDITSLIGYIKQDVSGNITEQDTLISALSKLEKNLDDKYNIGDTVEVSKKSLIADKISKNLVLNLIGNVTGAVEIDWNSFNVEVNTIVNEIPNIDASKITTGIIDIERLPAAALERLIEVENDNERFSLTKEQIQLGDTVKVLETLKMYKVIDENKLDSEDGYTVYVAGRAAEVPWNGVIGKPQTFTPSKHNHSSEEIISLTGYSKSSSSSKITPTDNLNSALGKLERQLDDKEPVITKKTGFNLDKSDSLELDSSDTLATSKTIKILNDKNTSIEEKLKLLQTSQDNNLNTTNKTITGAINELKNATNNKVDINSYSEDMNLKANINYVDDKFTNLNNSLNDKLNSTGGTVNGELVVTGKITSNSITTSSINLNGYTLTIE